MPYSQWLICPRKWIFLQLLSHDIMTIFAIILWNIWKWRNSRVFKGEHISTPQQIYALKVQVTYNGLAWCKKTNGKQ